MEYITMQVFYNKKMYVRIYHTVVQHIKGK